MVRPKSRQETEQSRGGFGGPGWNPGSAVGELGDSGQADFTLLKTPSPHLSTGVIPGVAVRLGKASGFLGAPGGDPLCTLQRGISGKPGSSAAGGWQEPHIWSPSRLCLHPGLDAGCCVTLGLSEPHFPICKMGLNKTRQPVHLPGGGHRDRWSLLSSGCPPLL